MPLMSGASASSLLRISPAAYDSGAMTRAMRASSPSTTGTPAGSICSPNGTAEDDQEDRLGEEDDDVPERATEEHRDPAHRRHPHAFHDAAAELRDEPEADERGAIDGDLDEQARDEPVERVRRRPGSLRRAVKEGPEQEQVEDRDHHPEEDPDRVVEGQPHRPGEDEPGVAERLHRRVLSSACRAAVTKLARRVRQPAPRGASGRSGGGTRRRGSGDEGRWSRVPGPPRRAP